MTDDLVEPFAFAVVSGQWRALVQRCAGPLPELAPADLAAAVVGERQRLGLESGDDFKRWLADLGISPQEWLDDLARRRGAADADSGRHTDPAATRAAWVAAVLGSWFDRWAREVARAAAAEHLSAPDADDPVDGPPGASVDDVVRAAKGTPLAAVAADRWSLVVAGIRRNELRRQAFAAALPVEVVESTVRARRLDWTRYRFAVEGDAVGVVEVRGDELPARVAGVVHAAAPGSIVADPDGRPVRVEVDGRTVTASFLVERVRPEPGDPAVRALVADTVLDRHLVRTSAATGSADPAAPCAEGEPQAAVRRGATTGRPRRRWRRRRPIARGPVVLQIDSDDCAAACLTMVARDRGHRPSPMQVRDACDADSEDGGTSLAAIVDAGATLGVALAARRASPSTLATLAVPFIAHWAGDHWIVVDHVADDAVDVRDPAIGVRRIPLDEFVTSWTGYAAVPVGDGSPTASPEPARPAAAWLWPLLRPHRGALLVALALTVGVAAAEIAVPLLGQGIIDRAASDAGAEAAWAMAMVGAVVFAVVADLVRRRLLVDTSARLDAAMLDHVTSRLLRLSASRLVRRKTGDLERRLLGLAEVRRVVVEQGIDAVTAAVLVVLATVALAVVAPLTAVVLVVTLPAYVVVARRSRRVVRPLFAAMEQAFGRYVSGQLDLLRGIETVKVHGAEQPAQERLGASFDLLRRRVVPARRAAAGVDVATNAVGSLLYASAVIVGARNVAGGSIGTLVAGLGLILLAVPAITRLVEAWDDVQISAVLLERVRDVLERADEPAGSVRPAAAGATAIELDGVTVRQGDRDVLRRIDLTVEPGSTVAVVGRSGSGKSTLLRVLAGLQPVAGGAVRLDGVDLAQLEPDRLRRRLGAVLQAPYVFAGTIAANVAFRRFVDDETVWDALRLAALDDVVARLPFGLDSLVGEGGLALSGGECQRLALARAVHDRPALLVLDEPTSALDPVTEELVRTNLATLASSVTTIIATHRLRIAADADLVVVLDAGMIVESGSHGELLAADGLYAHLCRQQGVDGC